MESIKRKEGDDAKTQTVGEGMGRLPRPPDVTEFLQAVMEQSHSVIQIPATEAKQEGVFP